MRSNGSIKDDLDGITHEITTDVLNACLEHHRLSIHNSHRHEKEEGWKSVDDDDGADGPAEIY